MKNGSTFELHGFFPPKFGYRKLDQHSAHYPNSNQSLLYLLVVFLRETTNTNFVVFGWIRLRIELLSHSLEHEQLHHIIDAVKARFKQMLHYISQKKNYHKM